MNRTNYLYRPPPPPITPADLVAAMPPPPPVPENVPGPVAGLPPPSPPPSVLETPPAMIDWLAESNARFDRGDLSRPMPALGEEINRILSLPIVPDCALAEGPVRCPDPEGYEQSLLLPNRRDKDFRLRPIQIDSIYEIEMYGGLFGPQGVGHGKTLVALVGAVKMIQRGHNRVCIMIPPQVYHQFAEQDRKWAQERANFQGIPFYRPKGGPGQRMAIAKKPAPAVWIYSYSSLSSQTGYDELRAIGATAYILDEAHNLARLSTARTKRWRQVLTDIEKEDKMPGPGRIEVVALSGTLTKKSVRDYSHLAQRCLREDSPVPIKSSVVDDFSAYLDVGGGSRPWESQFSGPNKWMQGFLQWARSTGCQLSIQRKEDESDDEYAARLRIKLTMQEEVRLAYMHRMHQTRGVVATSDTGVNCSLYLHWVESSPCEGFDKVQELMNKILILNETPSGDTIDFAMHQWKWLWELSNGFYNQLIWPSADQVREWYPHRHGKQISTQEAEGLLNQAQKHHGLLQNYHSILRKWLDRSSQPHCDTPMLVAQELHRQKDDPNHRGVVHPHDLVHAYWEQYDQGPYKYPDLPERISVPVRVCDYKLRHAAAWAKDRGEGIIWYHHPELGRWLCELLKQQDIRHTYAPAGANEKAYAEGIVVASYSHGTGKNLQHQRHNYMLELRREAHILEQTLGRTHRSGQKADAVDAYLSLATGFDLALFTATIADADYIQSTMGQKQRLCYANYDPPIPAISPRLMAKIGIIKSDQVDAISVREADTITPANIKTVADLVRPIAYANGQKS